MCVCSLSLFLFLSLFSLRSGGSNICVFFYTWPCLFGSSYQRRLVGAPSLCLPSFLSGPVWSKCLQTALRLFLVFICHSSSLFLSFLFLSHDRHGWAVPLPSFPSVYLPHFLSLCAPLASHWCSPQFSLISPCVSAFEAQIDELGKWNNRLVLMVLHILIIR